MKVRQSSLKFGDPGKFRASIDVAIWAAICGGLTLLDASADSAMQR
jgi:hypothetical protein